MVNTSKTASKAEKSPDNTMPAIIYAAVAGYVEKTYGFSRSQFVRPGADYKPGDVVVGNPSGSLAQAITYYQAHKINFFLFAPTMLIPYCIHNKPGTCGIICKVSVVYNNGKSVATSFVTNLEPGNVIIKTAPELQEALVQANELILADRRKALPKYGYPSGVLTAAQVALIAEAGIPYSLSADDAAFIPALDSQKATGKTIYGGGYLLSEQAQTAKARAEQARAEAIAAKAREEKDKIIWDLSEREKEIIESLK